MTITDQHYMHYAKVIAEHSNDLSRKTGCVIVNTATDDVIALGYNEFPTGVVDRIERRQRPAKYAFTEHAERRAIYACAKVGVSLQGCTVYLNWYPCADCARALVAVGSKRLVCYEPDWAEERYGFVDARTILEEGGVDVTFMVRM